ncbi:MAG: hypothetical protein SA339_00875 [Methanomassiliicoccus sp.]|nr:hypothetical protein [Methanomassiliicoccus sp.]
MIAAILISTVVLAMLLSQKQVEEKDVRLDFNDGSHPLTTRIGDKEFDLILEQGDEYYYGLTIVVGGQEYFSVIIWNETLTVSGVDFTVTHMDSEGIVLHLSADRGLL